MRNPKLIKFAVQIAAVLMLGCAAEMEWVRPSLHKGEGTQALAIYRSSGDVSLGEPLAVSVDFQGNMFIADGIPGRVVLFDGTGDTALEFQSPARSPGFYPCDLKLQGFFVYAVDEVSRTILRFDKDGAYRDILLNFNEELGGRRVSPYGMDVDRSGRIAVTDIENHRILLFDVYLSLELAFGIYGSFAGQLDSPEGVSFADNNRLLIANSGNRRIEIFDTGGTFLAVLPQAGEDNPLVRPRRAVMGKNGGVYVADPVAGMVFIFDQEGRLVRSLYPEGAVRFRPTDVEITAGGRLYVTDAASRTLMVFKVMSY